MLDTALSLLPLGITHVNLAAVLPADQLDAKLAQVQHAIDLEPHSSMPLVFRAAVFRTADRIEEALADLNRAVEVDRFNPQVYLERMILLVNHCAPQGLAQAMDDWTVICYLLADPRMIEGSITGVEGAITSDEWKGPIVSLLRGIAAMSPLSTQIQQQQPQFQQQRLTMDQMQQAADEAMRHMNQAIELKGDFAAAYRTRAFLNSNIMKQHREGLEDLTKAIELDDQMFQAYTERSGIMMYELQGEDKVSIDGVVQDRLALARQDLDKALELNEHYPETLLQMAMLHTMEGEMEAALPAFDRYIAVSPENYAAHVNRGIVNRTLGKFEDAVEDFSRAIHLRPDAVNVYALRAKTLSEDLKRPEEAEVRRLE